MRTRGDGLGRESRSMGRALAEERRRGPVRGAVAAVLAMATFGWAAEARADPIFYKISEKIGSGSVSGTVETDGKTGVLATGDVIGWDLDLNGAGSSFQLTNQGNQSTVAVTGSDLTASLNALLFNFSGSDGGIVAFQASNPGPTSGFHYWCLNTSNFACAPGASVVPGAFSDPSAQYQTESGTQVIGTVMSTGPSMSQEALEASLEALAQARTTQMLLNQLQSQMLLGLDEQVSCGSCGGGGATFGSFAASLHGRRALTDEWTLFGGVSVGEYRAGGAHVPLQADLAAAVQYDPAGMGPSRPFVEAGISGSIQHVDYARGYVTANGPQTGFGSARDYELSGFAQVGWVDRITPKDEAAITAGYTREWQFVGGYAENNGASNPFAVVMPSGTDSLNVASVSAQYTHLINRHLEAGINGGVDYGFDPKSGVDAQLAGSSFGVHEPNFVYYEAGGRIGVRVRQGLTLDFTLNSIIAPKAIGSSIHGGADVRFNF
jgi:hypothetical protein